MFVSVSSLASQNDVYLNWVTNDINLCKRSVEKKKVLGDSTLGFCFNVSSHLGVAQWMTNVNIRYEEASFMTTSFIAQWLIIFNHETMCWTFDKKRRNETRSIFKQKVWKIKVNYRVLCGWLTAESSIENSSKKPPRSSGNFRWKKGFFFEDNHRFRLRLLSISPKKQTSDWNESKSKNCSNVFHQMPHYVWIKIIRGNPAISKKKFCTKNSHVY